MIHDDCIPATGTMLGTHTHQDATGFWHFASEAPRCDWKRSLMLLGIVQCDKKLHVAGVRILPAPSGKFSVEVDGTGDNEHHVTLPNGVTELTWMAGDRGEFQGAWPGLCSGRVPGCPLPAGHHGRCAP